jgi:hypothetical protein
MVKSLSGYSDFPAAHRLVEAIPGQPISPLVAVELQKFELRQPRFSVFMQIRLSHAPTSAGIASQVWPSNSRPARFLRTPPHCLKKKGTRAL